MLYRIIPRYLNIFNRVVFFLEKKEWFIFWKYISVFYTKKEAEDRLDNLILTEKTDKLEKDRVKSFSVLYIDSDKFQKITEKSSVIK